MIALPWKKLCANFILPCGENHYGFFLRCPTSFYNRPNKLDELYKQNAKYENGQEYSKAIVSNGLLVVGMPTSKDIFDTAKAVEMFGGWLEQDKDKYPEFINLFLYLMQTDNRQYR